MAANKSINITEFLAKSLAVTNSELDKLLPTVEQTPAKLHEAMRYSVLNGGKRLRPALVFATGESFDTSMKDLVNVACCIELIHTFSLIHDDLPSIDNSDLRRGKATCHKQFDEPTAILAGDALLVLAFKVIVDDVSSLDAGIGIKMINYLAKHVGSLGLAGGEYLDIKFMQENASIEQLKAVYQRKTADLINASIYLAAIRSRVTDETVLNDLQQFAIDIGTAFQIHDDILELEVSTRKLGKPKGLDEINSKPTYPSIIGITASKQIRDELISEAFNRLDRINIQSDRLRQVARYLITRDY